MSQGTRYKFQGSQIQVLTAFDADSPPLTITAVTQANPAVVSFTGTPPNDGDVIKIASVVGMTELNGHAYIVDNVGGGTLELVGVDSSGYNAYTSGGTISLGSFSNFCELTNYNRTGGTSPEIPATTLCSDAQEYELGLPDFGNTALTFNFAPQTAVQGALHEWYLSGDEMAIRVELPNNGGIMVQKGFVQQETETAGVGTLWTATATIRNTGNRFDLAA